MERANRQLTMLDPKTHAVHVRRHLLRDASFAVWYDANDILWTSGGGPVIGWINMKILDETGDVAKAQGWTAMILDTNGNGKRDEYVEPTSQWIQPRTSASSRAFTP